jgi:Protein of unknown function (DUF2281)
MTAQMVPTTVVSPHMLGVLEKLSPELRQQVFDFAEFLGQRQGQVVDEQSVVDLEQITAVKSPRIFGLHAGQVWMSDDFDDPLPDEFWFGENDPLMMTDEPMRSLNQQSAL